LSTWAVLYDVEANEDLDKIQVHDLRRIHDAIAANLVHEPNVRTRNRKPLKLVSTESEVRETWELRVGDYRVFYDVDPQEGIVTILKVRKKPPHRTTEDIL